VSVIQTLTCSSITVLELLPRSSVCLLLGFSAMPSVSLVSQVTAKSVHDNMLGVNSHIVSGHEISRLQHGLQLIMARYTRTINRRPCCNQYIHVHSCIFSQKYAMYGQLVMCLCVGCNQ